MTRAIREHFAEKVAGRRDGFRWRGGEISRLEGFSVMAVHGSIGRRRRKRLREKMEP